MGPPGRRCRCPTPRPVIGELTLPLISVVTPVYRVAPGLLLQTIATVQHQDFDGWELCLVDDGSDRPELAALLSDLAVADGRIRVIQRPVNGGISAATNDGLAVARGEYVAFLDHDGLLAPSALARVAELIAENADADVVYTDEATIALDGSVQPSLKPDWSPDYLEACMYLGQLAVYRRSLVQELGGLRGEYDGAQDFDLALRATEATDRVFHVSQILYFCRAVPGSTRIGVAKEPRAVDAAGRALEGRLARQGTPGVCERATLPLSGSFRLRRAVRGRPLVTVVVPTAGHRRILRGRRADLIADCLTSVLEKTSYEPFEVICVVDHRLPSRVDRYLMGLDRRVRVVRTTEDYNFSHRINLGAAHARGEYLLLLNDDTEVIAGEWMTSMLEIGQDAGVGAVGAKLYLADTTVQHAGVALGGGWAAHIGLGCRADEPGHLGMLALNTNRSAVTGACLLTPTELFRSVGGLSTIFVVLNDVDYCFKVRARGYRIVMVPAAELFHFESSSRVPWGEPVDTDRLIERWPGGLDTDPFYNPNFVGNPGGCQVPKIDLPDGSWARRA
jgi:O-antigen biosynthesis protein